MVINFDDWIVGFTEAEGCFVLNRNEPQFTIVQKTSNILERIKNFFNEGAVYYRKNEDIYEYKVSGMNCWKIRDFFEKKELFTLKKNRQFEKWKTRKWLFWGPKKDLTKKVKYTNFDSWMIGFIEGEECFTTNSTKYSYPLFTISQNEEEILKKIKKYFEIGNVYFKENPWKIWDFRIARRKCWKIRNFCENQLKIDERKKQFLEWKNSNWSSLSEQKKVRDELLNSVFNVQIPIL